MEISVEKKRGVAIVSLMDGHLDASNAEEFRNAMAPVLEQEPHVVFDLCAVGFIDSSGLGALLSCLRQLNSRGGELKLCGMTKPVQVLFELVRMNRVFEIFSGQDEAIRAFAE